MENKVVSTRGVRLKYKDNYVQAVILPDGRKLAITGTTYGLTVIYNNTNKLWI